MCTKISLIGLLPSFAILENNKSLLLLEDCSLEDIDLYKIRYVVKAGLSSSIDLTDFKPGGLILFLNL